MIYKHTVKKSVFTVLLAIALAITSTSSCAYFNNITSTHACSPCINTATYGFGTLTDISFALLGGNSLLIDAGIDKYGQVWSLVNSSEECQLVRYDVISGKSKVIHSFDAKSQLPLRSLSGTTCTVHCPEENVVYVFDNGRNMQLIDLGGKYTGNIHSAQASSSLFWTDTNTGEIFHLDTDTGKCEPILDKLLEYANIEIIGTYGSNLLLRALSLKNMKTTELITDTSGNIIQSTICPDCIYGTLGSTAVRLHITENTISLIFDDNEYPLALNYAPVSAQFTDSGLLAVLCTDDNKTFQLVCYEIIEEQPFYIGSDTQSFETAIPLTLAGITSDENGHITSLLSSNKDDSNNSLFLWQFCEAECTALFGAPDKDTDALAVFGDNISAAAADIENKYRVRVLYGDAATLAFPDYIAAPVYDETLIVAALEKLDIALSRYPDGFFECITDGVSRGILFCLTGRMTPTNNVNIDDPEAFTVMQCGTQIIALNIASGNNIETTIFHEMAHATDKKIAAGAADGSIVFSENTWERFNPTGFKYYNAYLDPFGNSYSYTGGLEWTAFDHTNPAEEIYFVDSYSKTFPTEDRARLMEVIMAENEPPQYIFNKNIQAKLQYYFSAIRQIPGLDCSKQLYWERALLTPAVDVTGR